jgi:hypothetical protein
MDVSPRTKIKPFRVKRSGFEQTVLLLQGGGRSAPIRLASIKLLLKPTFIRIGLPAFRSVP